MKNAFHMEIPTFGDLLEERMVRLYVQRSLDSVLAKLGIENREDLIADTLDLASTLKPEEYEVKAHALLEDVSAKFPDGLYERAKIVAGHVEPHLEGALVFDYGCGDGRVDWFLQEWDKEHRLFLVGDVYKNPDLRDYRFVFFDLDEGTNMPIESNEFDTTLALMVLHHTDNPDFAISEMKRVTKPGGRAIVIESVYGIPAYTNEDTNLPQEQVTMTTTFKGLSKEQQRLAGIFFDHFYNRVVCDPELQVNVPYNFNTPDGWKSLFQQHSLQQESVLHLGVDHALVPEYHTMHILRKD